MLTTILSALCALTLSGNIATAQADTLNVYMINGDKITNFDGSQLVGKTVSEYRIGIATNNATKEVTKIHMIKTIDQQLTIKPNSDNTVNNVIYVIDGVEASSMDFIQTKQSKIGTMTICKAGSKEALEWTDDENVNVIKLETSKAANVYVDNIYIVGGKEVSSEEFMKLKPKDLAAMTIYKAGSKEALKWTDRTDKNVIVVDKR